METIHCNSCSHAPHLPGIGHRRYFISSCGHVFCINCVPQSQSQCCVCKAENSRFQEINQNSRPDIKAYFMDPLAVLRENLKQTTQVLNFQKSQAKSFQGCLTKLYTAYNSKVQENSALQKANEELNRKVTELQRKLEEMNQEQQSWMGNRNRTNFIQKTPSGPNNNQFGFSDMRLPQTPSDAGTPFVVNMSNDARPLFSPAPSSNPGRRDLIPGGACTSSDRPTLPRASQDTLSAIANIRRTPTLLTPGRRSPQIRSSDQTSDHMPSQDIVSRLRQLQRPSMCTPPNRNYMH